MKPTIRFVVLTALRDRLFVALFAFLAITYSIAAYLGGGAVAEAEQMTVVYAAGAARYVLVLGLSVFVAFNIERLFETREIEAILSRAISREAFVFSYWLGIGAAALLILVPAVAVIFVFELSFQGAFFWAASVFMETLVVVAFAVFCGMTMERAIPTIFATIGFYVLARLIGVFTGIASGTGAAGTNQVANPIMEAIGYLVPRLDLAGQTQWLVYGLENKAVFALIALQATIYIPLLLAATMFDLRKKNF